MGDISQKKLEGVPPLAWGKNGDCTFIGALEAATAVTPWPCRYTTMMGVTGLAFRIRWFTGPDEIGCPSSPVGEFQPEVEAAGRATGWELAVEWPGSADDQAAMARRFKETIDRGLPALVYGAQMNMAVACGYEENGGILLLRDYTVGDDYLRKPTSELEMCALLLDGHTEPLSPMDAALQGIGMGVTNWKRVRETTDNPERGYWHGPKAYQAWRDVLERVDTFDDAAKGTAFFLNWWTFECLADARYNAGAFLRETAPLFAGEARSHLEKAAGIYEDEFAGIRESFEKRHAFIGPWSGLDITSWNPEMRQREMAMLTRAEELEALAITEMETALNAN